MKIVVSLGLLSPAQPYICQTAGEMNQNEGNDVLHLIRLVFFIK